VPFIAIRDQWYNTISSAAGVNVLSHWQIPDPLIAAITSKWSQVNEQKERPRRWGPLCGSKVCRSSKPVAPEAWLQEKRKEEGTNCFTSPTTHSSALWLENRDAPCLTWTALARHQFSSYTEESPEMKPLSLSLSLALPPAGSHSLNYNNNNNKKRRPKLNADPFISNYNLCLNNVS